MNVPVLPLPEWAPNFIVESNMGVTVLLGILLAIFALFFLVVGFTQYKSLDDGDYSELLEIRARENFKGFFLLIGAAIGLIILGAYLWVTVMIGIIVYLGYMAIFAIRVILSKE